MPALTPSLVYAAYRRALRFGVFWRLRPEERAILVLASRLRAIRSPALREAVIRVLERVWPEKARTYRAFEAGVKVLLHRVSLALKIGAAEVAQALLAQAHKLIPTLGYSYLNTPSFYRPSLGEAEG
jgi:hypothetical protein